MLGFIERSTIKLLKERGNNNTQIANALGRDRKTVQRALLQPADKKLQRKKRGSLVDGYEELIRQWIIEDIPVTVMLQRARQDSNIPYQGGTTIGL